MTDMDTRKPEFNRAVRGYDRLQVDDYIFNLHTQLREAEQRAQEYAAKMPAKASQRAGSLHPLPTINDETPAPASGTAAEAKLGSRQRQSALEELTRERDRLMSEISDLERRRAAILGASLAETARR